MPFPDRARCRRRRGRRRRSAFGLLDDVQSAGRGHRHFDDAHATGLDGVGCGDQLFRRLRPHNGDDAGVTDDVEFFVFFHVSLQIALAKGTAS